MHARETIYTWSYTWSRLFCLAFLAAAAVSICPVVSVRAQNTGSSSTEPVRYVVDGSEWVLPVGIEMATGEGDGAPIESILDHFRNKGYHGARVDSVGAESSATVVYISRGIAATVRALTITGVSEGERAALSREILTGPGLVLDADVLSSDEQRILAFFADRGFHGATISLVDLVRAPGDALSYDIYLDVQRGAPITIRSVELPGGERTNLGFAARAAGVRVGDVLAKADLGSFSARLRDTDVFRRVDEARLELTPDSAAILVVPVEELPPGSFDLVLGYLPPGGRAVKAQVIGSGHLNLLSPFGYGRSFGLRLDRRPGQVSSVDVRLRDPLLAGLPLRAEASFAGIQQDSTYNRRQWGFELGYGLLPGVEIAAHLAIELTRPGGAGLRLRGSRQRIPRSEARFWGLVLRLKRLDRTFNPRSGVFLESLIENGDETERYKLVLTPGDTTRIATKTRQERFRFSARTYVPVFKNQVLVGGADLQVLLSDAFDESDLFRVGGANSLRGYDEDQFLASAAVRLVFEYRVLLDALSHAFVFLDMGYIQTPKLLDVPADRQWYPGFGVGMQLQTAPGIASVSYAMNDQDGVINGRVHLGISFGL